MVLSCLVMCTWPSYGTASSDYMLSSLWSAHLPSHALLLSSDERQMHLLHTASVYEFTNHSPGTSFIFWHLEKSVATKLEWSRLHFSVTWIKQLRTQWALGISCIDFMNTYFWPPDKVQGSQLLEKSEQEHATHYSNNDCLGIACVAAGSRFAVTVGKNCVFPSPEPERPKLVFSVIFSWCSAINFPEW